MIVCIGASATMLQAAMKPSEPSPNDADAYWPQWRGPTRTGVAPLGDPPVEWSESKNVRWKVAIPGRGHATPIVWGDRIYVQTAVMTDREIEPAPAAEPPAEPRAEEGGGRRERGRGRMASPKPTNIHEFVILALDRKTGGVVWQKLLREELPHEGGREDSSQASNSPATDGEVLIAFFGSRGLHCLDMEGEVIWQRDLGKMQTANGFGEGTSPALHGDTVVINWDHEGQSYIVAFNKETGEELWEVDRDERTSWATPLVVEHDGKPQVVTSATNLIRSSDLATGELLWQCKGMTRNAIPSPVADRALLYATSGFRGSALLAIRYAEAKGDITDSPAVVWKYEEGGTPYVPSPLLYDDLLYFLDTNQEVLSCVDAKSGKPHYTKQRLEELQGVYASPVGASRRVYIAGRNGVTAVLRHGPEFELLATNKLDDKFSSSPVIAGSELYLRGHAYLYCIAAEEEGES
ncbi:MAG: PQQ-binding-like beta-propeller repeat protein [Planctomycetota bacterium]